jgi:regulation of enolase protein 1 (concanavalin A-like superfamily)
MFAPRSLPLCLLLAFTGIGAGQDEKKVTLPGWGEFIDPAGDCKVREDKGIVTITVPGSHHNLNPLPEYNLLGPRLLQPAAGDFDIEVKVLKFVRPDKGTSSTKSNVSYTAAGLLIWQDDKTFLRSMRAAHGERNEVFVHVEAFRNAAISQGKYFIKKVEERVIGDEPIYYRAERRGNDLTVSRSPDGKEWKVFSRHPINGLKKELLVGVGVVNSTNREFSAHFADFKLTPK